MSDPATPSTPHLPKWLFWTLLVVLLVPAGLFTYSSYDQLQSILADVKAKPSSAVLKRLVTPGDIPPDVANAVALEYDVMQHRHQRTTAFIITRTWMRFMSLIFGTLMVTVGAAFTLGRVSGPDTEVGAENGDWKASLKSSSPGLVLAGFGLVLIAIPNLSTQTIETNDGPTYYQAGPAPRPGGEPPPLSEADRRNIQELIDQFSPKQNPP